MTNHDTASQDQHTPKPTDPSDADPNEVTSPGGQAEELTEMAQRSGASTDPADCTIGEAQLEAHGENR